MALKPNTILLLLIALVFGGGMLIWELTGPPSQPKSESDTEQPGQAIFAFKEDDIEQVTVKLPEQTLVFARSAQQFPATWQMQAPQQMPVDEAAIAFLLSQLAAARSQRTVDVSSSQLANYGLVPPTATIQVTLKTKDTHTLILGKENYNQSALYAQVNPPPTAQYPTPLKLVPTTLQDAVSRPLDEWKSKPPPSPSPASSPAPATPSTPSVAPN